MPSDSTIPTTSTPTPDLAQALRGLGLRLIAEQLDDFVAHATRRRASPRQLLEELARLEAQERARKSVERRSIVLTTNLVFAEWNTVFPNAACATALIDRLTHHAEVLVIKGESYRKREAELAQKARRRGERVHA